MNEANLKAIALFFFYAFLDEPLARLAAAKVVSRFKKYERRGPKVENQEAAIVFWTQKYWKRFSRRENSYSLVSGRGWRMPSGIDLDAWKQFKRETQQDEFLSVIWSKILGFTDEQIAEGLKLTTGTVRHRIGRGVKALGEVIESGRFHAQA